jgi:isoquinoline 1-oxidoreductase beta subunit
VAEISVTESDGLTVHRVVCALDCGTIVNPALVRDQATGGTLFGLSASMYEAVTVANGHIDQKGFDTYRLMRLSETPAIEVHLIASDAAPTGVGEIATAPIGAAVCNALFAATGRRVRTLPLVPQG